jgi:hypothetical protein
MIESARSSSAAPHHHAVRFYENDKSLARIVARFLSDGLDAGNPAIVVATPGQRAAILRELVARSLDVVELQRSNDLILLDARDTLSTFMIDGEPDAETFRSTMCETIRRACHGRTNCTVRIYGQMVDLLWKHGQQQAAIRLEMLWNRLAATNAFSLWCGYSMGHFYKDASRDDICSHHTHILGADGEATAVA